MPGRGGGSKLSFAVTPNPLLVHQSSYPLPTYPLTPFSQVAVNPRRAIGVPTGTMKQLDLLVQNFITLNPSGFEAYLPVIETPLRYSEYLAHQFDRVGFAMGFHKCVSHLLSRAKKRAGPMGCRFAQDRPWLFLVSHAPFVAARPLSSVVESPSALGLVLVYRPGSMLLGCPNPTMQRSTGDTQISGHPSTVFPGCFASSTACCLNSAG